MPRIINFEGKTQSFPDDATDAEISAALNAIPASNAKDVPKAKTWTAQGDSGALATSGAASMVGPTAVKALEAFGTSPTAAKTAGALARGATTLGALGHGVATGNLSEIVAAPLAGWQAGKGGYFLGKGAQSIARPMATALEKVAPIVQGLSAIGGAQGVGDLAQMAEPNRQDIGFLGMAGKGSASDQAAVIGAQIKALTAQGMKPGDAARTVYNAWAKQLREQTK